MIEFLKNLLGRKSSPSAADSGYDSLRLVKVKIVVIQVLGLDPEQLQKRLGLIADLASENRGLLSFTQSDIALIVFRNCSGRGAALKFKSALVDQLPTQIKFLYGNTTTHDGSKGGPMQKEYGFIYPGLAEAIEVLQLMEFGSMQKHEFPQWFEGKDEPPPT
jgi:hypothetical protein